MHSPTSSTLRPAGPQKSKDVNNVRLSLELSDVSRDVELLGNAGSWLQQAYDCSASVVVVGVEFVGTLESGNRVPARVRVNFAKRAKDVEGR